MLLSVLHHVTQAREWKYELFLVASPMTTSTFFESGTVGCSTPSDDAKHVRGELLDFVS
jgi:hypothetical protein